MQDFFIMMIFKIFFFSMSTHKQRRLQFERPKAESWKVKS
jgi:hypothetical protein